VLTEGAIINGRTETREGVEALHACTAILTRIGGAFVDLRLTEKPRIARKTSTRERVDGI
jgi:hypothetical protein